MAQKPIFTTLSARDVGTYTGIQSLLLFGDSIFGLNIDRSLYKWNGIDSWILKEPSLDATRYAIKLIEFNSKAHSVTELSSGTPYTALYECYSVSTWTQVVTATDNVTYQIGRI